MSSYIKASEYCESIFDGTHDTPKPSRIGRPLLTSKNILGGRLDLSGSYNISIFDYEQIQRRSAVSQWDILFSMIGSVGEVYLETSNSIDYAIKNVGVFSARDEDRARWLYLYLTSPYSKKFINNYMTGAVQKFLGLGVLRDFPVLPYDDTKKPIINLVTALDDKIELNQRINAELEQMARTLYDYWFTQFDFPDAQGKPYKSSGGAMVYNDQLKRDVPAQWEVKSLRELIAVSKNGDWGKSENGSGCIKAYCVRGADINGLNGLTGFDPPVRYIESSHANRTLKSDDLVVEISGGSPTQSTGRMAHISKDVIDRLQGDVVCSNFCKAISLKNERLSYVVNHYWNHLYESGTFFNFEGKTSGIKNLMFDQLVIDVKLALPGDSALIDKYYALAKVMDSQKQANLSQNEELVRLRDWLLPMLMTGQVRVMTDA